ncbi:MAG: hypothetical protein R6T99_07725 [Bacteroidales bacterium]
MQSNIRIILLALSLCGISIILTAGEKTKDSLFKSKTFSGLKLRGIGPAFKSGRIADIAIHPENENIWYVAVGSGGIWKTVNSGTTWAPVFDDQSSYSIGCVTVDPRNPNTVWAGTGENIGGRHVGFGDGVYRSDDGGSGWKNMGLKDSEHISKILIHPENSGIIWVAAQGPLWSRGGDRGVYKSVDGGKNWKKTLGDDEWTGATDIVMDPRDPDRLYAATWQRHRNVAAYMGGGPGSGLHRSEDGGETWVELKKGLPSSNMGKIGLAISPQKPDVLYAAIELDRRTGGVYRSDDRGASWEKMSEAVSGATGPHYYQELYASPHEFDKLYLVDVRMQVSEDGGKTFRRMKEHHKHSDNHALCFREDDPDYLLVGTDGGLYISYDGTENWDYIANLPVTQFYKLAVDDAKPFYHIIGGTQDNGTQGGPSRTDKREGISNEDWYMVLGADGHQPATEPGNPDIVYAESQQGYLVRKDMTTGETVNIQPQPAPGEDYERFNWDSPILVSPHSPTRLYFASQRVWRSDNRGDSWVAVSGDLTRDQERITLPIMDNQWSWDSPWDMDAMSNYNTITSLAESPLEEGLIYAGTDDGFVQVTENGGETWRKIDVSRMPGVPEKAFVNDIKACLFDANTVFVALDNHKSGDFSPYLMKSEDRGNSWEAIQGDIPDKHLVWRVVQDHVRPGLLFSATEFGIFFTIDGGERWMKLTGGVPTISFRDLAIHRREHDLIGASFGRSFYIFDDYTVLRHVSEEQLKEEATLFPIRDAWWYNQRYGKGSQGASYYTAPNPPYGAVFTYYLSEGYKQRKAIRRKKEKELVREGKPVPFPGWDSLERERRQAKPVMVFTVRDSSGNVIRRIEGPAGKGFHRVAWDLRYPSVSALDIHSEHTGRSSGLSVAPGRYTVSLAKKIDGIVTELAGPVAFRVRQMYQGALEGASQEEIHAFVEEVRELQGAVSALNLVFSNARKKVKAMQTALDRSGADPGEPEKELYRLREELLDMEEELYGNRSKREIGEKSPPTISRRLYFASSGTGNTYGPTPAQKESLEMAEDEFGRLQAGLQQIVEERIPKLEKVLSEAGAPWIEGMPFPEGE